MGKRGGCSRWVQGGKRLGQCVGNQREEGWGKRSRTAGGDLNVKQPW